MDKMNFIVNNYIKPNIYLKDLLSKLYNFLIVEIGTEVNIQQIPKPIISSSPFQIPKFGTNIH
jgi:hypothetical protein